MSWRRLFPLIFLFSCVDGFISNWLYPARLPMLFKDIFILVVYFLFMTQEFQRHWVGKFKRSIGLGTWYIAMLFVLVGILQMFNSKAPGMLVGILGFKVMFLYLPMAILAYAYVDSLDRLRRLLRAIIYFSIPISIFGLFQFWADPYFMINTFGPGFERAMSMASIDAGEAATQTFLRVFGTFASTGQFSSFLVINCMFIFSLLFTAKNKFERRLMIGCAILNFITLLATGSRGGFLLIFIMGFVFVVFCRRFWRRLVFMFLLAVSLYAGFSYLGRGVVSRFKSLKDTEMLKSRTIGVTKATFMDYFERYPLGNGIGTGSGASRYLSEGEEVEWEFIESYPAKLQYETGILGVILFYLFLLKLSVHWLRHWLKPVDFTIYTIIASLSSLCLVFFFYSLVGIIDSSPLAIFLWATVGIVAKLTTFQSNAEYPVPA